MKAEKRSLKGHGGDKKNTSDGLKPRLSLEKALRDANHTHTNIYSSPLLVSSHSACGLSWGRRWGGREKWGRRRHNLSNTTSHSGTRKLVSASLGSLPRPKVLPECRVSLTPSTTVPQSTSGCSQLNLVPTKSHPHRRPKDKGQPPPSSSPQEPQTSAQSSQVYPAQQACLTARAQLLHPPQLLMPGAGLSGGGEQFRWRPRGQGAQTRRRKELGLWSQQKGIHTLTPLMNWLCDPQQA